MTGFALLTNYAENPEALLRKTQPCVASSSATPLTNEPINPAPFAPNTMAQKTLHEYSIPAIAYVPIGPTIDVGDANFELKTSLIMMVQANPFC
jgi:hypothetical protein